ncbi:MAG: phosphoribosylanthranilate isomerase [Saprospiraceae bacterium]|nr:phosphoribosylanthranilate isomerase [Saprospiraceae bacterium]
MIVKVCGMTTQANLDELLELRPAWFGMIHYPLSKRHVVTSLQSEGAKRIGVFVNEEFDQITKIAARERLDGVQLHGEEAPGLAAKLRAQGLLVIKAFSVKRKEDLLLWKPYQDSIDYLLFDTKGPERGGNGVAFDWDLLHHYQGDIPFLLAGGIGPDSLVALAKLDHPKWVGIDINSRFEVKPGIKDITLIKNFLHELRSR